MPLLHLLPRRARALAVATVATVATVASSGCGDAPTAADDRLPHQAAIRDIGGLRVASGWAVGINGAGHVVGRVETEPASGVWHAFHWTHRLGMRDIGTLAHGSQSTIAEAINDRDEVVGLSGVRAFLWTPSAGMKDLGIPSGGTFSAATDISEDGRIVGIWIAGGVVRPFLWVEAGGFRVLPVPEGLVTASAAAVNRHGEIVGYGCGSPCLRDFRALRWLPDGTVQDLSAALGSSESYALGISDKGEIVGATRKTGERLRAYLMTPAGEIRDLGTLSGALDSRAEDISEEGHVVGWSGDRAFLWTARGGMRDLGALPSEAGAESRAFSVNRFGQSVGNSRLSSVHRPILFPTVP